MTIDKSRRRLPPYISYRTFDNFIGRLQQQVPSRIDRSYWGETLSGSTGTQLMAALRFLNLVDTNGKPTNQLKLIAASKGEQRTEALKEITWDAYDFVLRSSLDIQNATYSQLEEVFHDNFQLTADVGRKCIKFFISLASSAGTALSPFVTKRVRLAHSGTGTSSTKSVPRKIVPRANRNALIPDAFEGDNGDHPATSVHSLLLSKFPAFDPGWSEELKSKWFTAYDELLKRYPGRP
ncbi:MAG TPA: DUF5343 domain-containing protein [Dehalococcoidales bacterium]|nr:DUF5343 domain-containing protein [Dehalococcoidales bacterium]